MDANVDAFAQVSGGVDQVVEKITVATSWDLDPDKLNLIYDNWAAQYNKDKSLLAPEEVKLYGSLVQKVREAYPHEQSIKVLDVGAGTGILGQKLKEAGYTNIDGVDANAKMLEVCRERGIYTNLYPVVLGDNPVPVESDSYDILVSVASFVKNHITESCFEELIRITKPGGQFVIAMHYAVGDPGYGERFLTKVDQLESEGLWKVKERMNYQETFSGITTLIFCIEKC